MGLVAALVLVDLQADFLSPKQDGSAALIDPQPFNRPVAPHGIASPFPGPPCPPELQSFESYLTSTHTSSRFCTAGSPGTALLPSLAILKHPHHISIQKAWYSSFTETSLHETLRSRDVTHLYVAGMITNTCVAATSVHARRLGYNVTIIDDLVFALKPDNHSKTLLTLASAPYDIFLCTSEKTPAHVDQMSGKVLPTLYYVNGSIPSWRVMPCLSLKHIPYSAIRLRVMTTPKETRSPEFAAINPRCKTPTFVDVDGTVVIESLAILQYLEQYYSSQDHPHLLPDISRKKEWTREVTRIAETENPHNIYQPIELLYLPDWKEHSGAIVQAYKDIIEEMAFRERYSEENASLSGDVFGRLIVLFIPFWRI